MKRVFDLFASLVTLICLFPLFMLIAFLIWLNLGSPIFFRQQRPGLSGHPFQMIKFRTMRVRDEARVSGAPLYDSLHLNYFGKILRASSLDELPEIWNVLRGDMSLVGPRPLLMEYLPLYSPSQYRRHEVRPGITGWAQVNGRNKITWEERFKLDIWYIDHQSFWLDMKILLMTLKKVLVRESISAEWDATMPVFTGNDLSKNEK